MKIKTLNSLALQLGKKKKKTEDSFQFSCETYRQISFYSFFKLNEDKKSKGKK